MNELYSRLSITEKTVYMKIVKAIEHLEDNVSFVEINNNKILEKALTAIKLDHPEFFYIDFQRINYVCTASNMIYRIKYIVPKAQIAKLKEQLSIWVDTVKTDITFLEALPSAIVCRNIHNYIIRHVKYNYKALQTPEAFPEAFSLMGVFKHNEAVCEGIAKAFKYLCNQMNVEKVIIVEGISSQEGVGNHIPHAWNMVKIDDKYSHVDVTWDLEISRNSKSLRYDYYMIPDKWIKKDHVFHSTITCDSEIDSYFYQQNALIKDSASLSSFFDATLKCKSIFYFKVTGEKSLPSDISVRIQRLLQTKMIQAKIMAYEIAMAHNESQNVYFFNIKR